MVQHSWPGPMPPGRRAGTIRLVRCAQCKERLYYTKLKGQPRQEDHEQGCQAFITAIRVVRYADELKQAALRTEPGRLAPEPAVAEVPAQERQEAVRGGVRKRPARCGP